jgi:hypothetical protein
MNGECTNENAIVMKAKNFLMGCKSCPTQQEASIDPVAVSNAEQSHASTANQAVGVFRCQFFFGKVYVALFVVI